MRRLTAVLCVIDWPLRRRHLRKRLPARLRLRSLLALPGTKLAHSARVRTIKHTRKDHQTQA